MATLIVHGGAGRWDPRIPRAEIDAGLDRALETGWRALEDGALSAVVAAANLGHADGHDPEPVVAITARPPGGRHRPAPRSPPAPYPASAQKTRIVIPEASRQVWNWAAVPTGGSGTPSAHGTST